MRALVIPALAAVLVIGVMLFQATAVDAVLCAAPAVRLGEIDGFESEAVPVSEAERTVLPADTGVAKRHYRGPDGRTFQVTAVISGRSKASVHRPELCLPAQGFQMSAPRDLTAAGVDWRAVTLARQRASSMGFAYMFFNQEGFRTASHLQRIFRDVWDRSMRGRIDRWVMITVFASADDATALEAFLVKLKGVLP